MGNDVFPTFPEMIANFIPTRAPYDAASTLRRRLYATREVSRLLKLLSLVDDEEVRIALRQALQEKRSRMKQALGLKKDLLERLMAACGSGLLDLRYRTLWVLCYSTLCRRGELVAIRVEDFGKVDDDGSVSVLIRWSKSDPFGFGRVVWVPSDVMTIVKE